MFRRGNKRLAPTRCRRVAAACFAKTSEIARNIGQSSCEGGGLEGPRSDVIGIDHRPLTPGDYGQSAIPFSFWTFSLVEGFQRARSKIIVGAFQSLIYAVQKENIWISSGNKGKGPNKNCPRELNLFEGSPIKRRQTSSGE